MVKVTIDGQELEVASGKTIIQAAHEHGIAIPYYCYHPGLVVDGNCRICLVEVEKAPKLMVACKTAVADGMVVNTKNERVETARRSVMEFLLINHPIDCPVCDQAGECKLQDYYYNLDLAESRMKDRKVHKPKVVDFGQHVKFDGERCILCSRCVRFTRDISESYELSIYNRGDQSVIDLTPGMTLDNDYSMNTVDICPVGALTSKDFRFRKRVWMLDEHDSVCPGCSRGCAVKLDKNGKEDKVYRTRPRKNMLTNTYWMCDYGRFMFEYTTLERLDRHTVAGEPATTEQAAQAAGGALKSAGKVGILASRWASNEELFALKGLADAVRANGSELIVAVGEDRVAAEHETGEDDFLIEADKNPNARGARERFGLAVDGSADGVESLAKALNEGAVDVLLLTGFGHGRVLGDAIKKAGKVVRLSAHGEELAAAPDVVLAARTWAEKEGSFTNSDGVITAFTRAIHGPPGAADDLKLIGAVGAVLGAELPGTPEEAWAAMGSERPEWGGIGFADLKDRVAIAPGQTVEVG